MARNAAAKKNLPGAITLRYAQLGHPGKHIEGKLQKVINRIKGRFLPTFYSTYIKGKITRNINKELISAIYIKGSKLHIDLYGKSL